MPLLYKYMSRQTGRVVLANRTLRWSTPRTLNDPYDVQFDLHIDVDREAVRAASLDKMWDAFYGNAPAPVGNRFGALIRAIRHVFPKPTREEFNREYGEALDEGLARLERALPDVQQQVRTIIADSKLLCLTESPDSNLMWAHYAEQHQGIVCGFASVQGLGSPYDSARPVLYLEEIRTQTGKQAHRVIMSDIPSANRVESTGTTRFTQDNLAAGNRILDTAHTQAGRPIPRAQVQGHHIVRVMGMTMRACDAQAAGYLDVSASGHYTEVGGGATAREPADKSEEPAPAAQQSEAERLADPDRDLKFLEAVSNADPEYTGDLHNETIEAAVAGTDAVFDAGRVATALGITPQQAQSRFAGMMETYQNHVDGTVKAAGVEDVQAFYKFVRAHRPDSMRDALRRVAHDGNASDFEQMARAYVEQGRATASATDDALADYSADDILSADFGSGITAGKGSDGTAYLLIPGKGVVEASEAIRSGLVKVSRR